MSFFHKNTRKIFRKFYIHNWVFVVILTTYNYAFNMTKAEDKVQGERRGLPESGF